MVYAFDLMRRGGSWLGTLRDRIKWVRCGGNGTAVTWGSDDRILPALTVVEVEELGAEATAAGINADRKCRDARWMRVVRRLWQQRNTFRSCMREALYQAELEANRANDAVAECDRLRARRPVVCETCEGCGTGNPELDDDGWGNACKDCGHDGCGPGVRWDS